MHTRNQRPLRGCTLEEIEVNSRLYGFCRQPRILPARSAKDETRLQRGLAHGLERCGCVSSATVAPAAAPETHLPFHCGRQDTVHVQLEPVRT